MSGLLLKIGTVLNRNRNLLGLSAIGLLLNILMASEMQADLVYIQYHDRGAANPATNGGPLWTGVVDTTANNLRIESWRELPQHGAEFWVPASLPDDAFVWTALDSNGAVYDIPDDFGAEGTVSIGDNFAFISPFAVQDMNWAYNVEGDGIEPQSRMAGAVLKPTRVGWGGYARQETPEGPFIFYTSAFEGETIPLDAFDEELTGEELAAFYESVKYDETTMPRLLVEDTNTSPFSNAMLASLNATVVSSPSPIITAIPEPSAFLSISLVSAAYVVGAWRRKRR